MHRSPRGLNRGPIPFRTGTGRGAARALHARRVPKEAGVTEGPLYPAGSDPSRPGTPTAAGTGPPWQPGDPERVRGRPGDRLAETAGHDRARIVPARADVAGPAARRYGARCAFDTTGSGWNARPLATPWS